MWLLIMFVFTSLICGYDLGFGWGNNICSRCLNCLWYLEGENKETLVYKQSDHGIDLSKNRLVFHISIITEIL